MKKIIWVGNLIERKRPLLFLECAKHYPYLHFSMIGDGELKNEVKAFLETNEITNVRLLGRISNEQVYSYLQNSDLLLMTSEFEGLPKVIQEAAQCGVPSIYMANNYSVDFIEDGVNGFAVYSLEEMIEKIRFLLDHPEEYPKMSKKAKEIISEYSWEKLIPRYEEWFLDVLERYRKEKGK